MFKKNIKKHVDHLFYFVKKHKIIVTFSCIVFVLLATIIYSSSSRVGFNMNVVYNQNQETDPWFTKLVAKKDKTIIDYTSFDNSITFFSNGSGEENNPFIIDNPKHLEILSNLVNNQYMLKRNNSIVEGLVTYKISNEYTPIVNDDENIIGYNGKNTINFNNTTNKNIKKISLSIKTNNENINLDSLSLNDEVISQEYYSYNAFNKTINLNYDVNIDSKTFKITFNTTGSNNSSTVEISNYKITTSDDLDYFDEGEYLSFNKAYYKVVSNLDLTETNVVIGNDANPFSGHIDFSYKYVKGIHGGNQINNGLFGVVNDAVIKSVILSENNIEVSTDLENYTGLLVGKALGNSKIYNIGVLDSKINITRNSKQDMYVGSIVGYLSGRSILANSYSYASITSSGADNINMTVGGLVGYRTGDNAKLDDNNPKVYLLVMYGNMNIKMAKSVQYVYNGNKFNASLAPIYCYYLWKGDTLDTNPNIDDTYAILKSYDDIIADGFKAHLNNYRYMVDYYVGNTQNIRDNQSNGYQDIAFWYTNNDESLYPIIKEKTSNSSNINLNDVSSSNVTNSIKVNLVNASNNNERKTYYLKITDKNESFNDYTNKKVVLPFNSKTANFKYAGTGMNNQYTMTLSGWELTSVVQDGNLLASKTEGSKIDYNYVLRNGEESASKDIGTVYAEGGFYLVPDGVTEVTLTAKFAYTIFVKDAYNDLVYSAEYGNVDSSFYGTTGSRNEASGLTRNDAVSTLEAAYSRVANIESWQRQSLYDVVIMLCGNLHYNPNVLIGAGSSATTSNWAYTSNDRPVTIMSEDLDGDLEPDYSLYTRNVHDEDIPSLRFNFVNVLGIPQVGTINAKLNAMTLMYNAMFEVTETAKTDRIDLRHYQATYVKLNSGYYDVYSLWNAEAKQLMKKYIYFGGYAKAIYFTSGVESRQTPDTTSNELPVFVISGGRIDTLASTYFNAVINVSNNMKFYIDGGYINNFYTTYNASIMRSAEVNINDSYINTYYSGGHTESSYVYGGVTTNVKNSRIGAMYGGPEYGTIKKGSTMNVDNSIIDDFYGSGYGGTQTTEINLVYQDAGDNICNNVNYYYNITNDCSIINNNDTSVVNKSYCFGRSSRQYGIETAFYSTTYTKAGCASKAFALYYSSLSAANVDKVTVNMKNSTINNDFYGGGNKGIVDKSIVVNMENTTIKGNLYGAGRSNEKETLDVFEDTKGYIAPKFISYTIDTEAIYPQKYTYTWSGDESKFNNSTVNTTEKLIYSENDGKLGNVNGDIYLNIKNSTIDNNVYGGGNLSEVIGNIHINLSGDNIISGDLYGGGNAATVTGDIDVRLNSQNLDTIYGGGNLGNVLGTSMVTVTNSTLENVYGGGNAASVSDTKLYLENGTINNVFGGSNNNGTVTNSNVFAGYRNEIEAKIEPEISDEEEEPTPGEPELPPQDDFDYLPSLDTCKDRDITYDYSYNNGYFDFGISNNTDNDFTQWNAVITFGNVLEPSTNNWSGHKNEWNGNSQMTVTHFGQWYEPDTTTLTAHTTTRLFNANYPISVSGSSIQVLSVVITAYDRDGKMYTNTICNDGVIPEPDPDPIEPDPDPVEPEPPVSEDIFITITNLYGGNNKGGLCDNTNVFVNSATVTNVYGGGNLVATNNSYVELLDKSSILENIYGGGNEAIVSEDIKVVINGSHILGSAYAGGNGTSATVKGNTTIISTGDTVIEKSLFGGGNAAETGTNSKNNSVANVIVTGGVINGNVYGGANTSKIYGYTNLSIGPSYEEYEKSDILINGTVFGGGEANASGSENYDYSYISVTKGIDLLVDEENTNILINGSIFGSGNASSTSGYSNIKLNNFGTRNVPKNLVSIQRASNLLLKNSSINLSGTTDRTNEFNSILYSLSRIDELNIANNSTLYIQSAINVVKEFNSLLIGENTSSKASVTIEDGNVVKNVDNRLYMVINKAFNIIDSENLSTGNFGNVNGMTFFGLFEDGRDGLPSTGIYNTKYNNGDIVTYDEAFQFVSGSYVMGLHKDKHNIDIDGFYTNYVKEDNSLETKYIEPSPEDAKYYQWIVGEASQTYEIALTASKFATMGTAYLPLLGFETPNTYFELLSYNDNNLESDVSLIDPDLVPRVAFTNEEAMKTFGLSMSSSNANWLTDGNTYFLSTEDKREIVGTTKYISNNTNEIPTLNFIFNHSRNIIEDKKLGNVTIGMLAYVPIDEVTYGIKRIYINVTMDTKYYENDNYESSMTPGKEYELFVNSKTDITSKSSLSAYFSLFVKKDKSIYTDSYHRVLISNYKLPENTRITMIDRTVENKPVYYYYVVDNTEKETEFVSNKDGIETEFYIYPLSNFVLMGSTSDNNNYNDADANKKYYNEQLGISEEEFIFIVDYSESNINENVVDAELLLELKDEDELTHYDSLGVSHSNMAYNIYTDSDSTIDIDINSDRDTAYHGYDFNLNATLDFNEKQNGFTTIRDTNFIQDKMGLKLSLYNSNGERVNGATLIGTVFTINGIKYYADIDGSLRANIADLVSDVKVNININLEKSLLATDNYTIVLESFGSPDGLYYGLSPSGRSEIKIDIVNENYGLNSIVADEDVVIDKTTGLNRLNSNEITYNIEYASQFINPNIRVKLYRRKYDKIFDTEYELVNLKDYISDDLLSMNEFEYLVTDIPEDNNRFIIHMNEKLKTGTYKVTFELYNNNTYIDEVYSYMIIR